MQDRPAGQMVRCSKARAMFAMRACRKSIMIGTPLNKRQMTTVCLLPQDSACTRVMVCVVLELILVLTGGAAHGDHGPAMALSSWPAHHASPVGYRGYGVGP